MGTLAGKVAVITGCGSIGAATARVFAERGASVVIGDIRADAAESVARDLRSDGLKVRAVATDLAKEADIQELISTAVREFGGLDILHNNAALVRHDVVDRDEWFESLDGALFEDILRINVIAPALCIKHAIPEMLKRGGGVIINTASLGGSMGQYQMPMYGMSKAAVIGMIRNVATQYSAKGIRAVGISPGMMETKTMESLIPSPYKQMWLRQTLIPRLGSPEDIAYLAAFLASDEAGYITGLTINCDGGFGAHMPTYGDEAARPVSWGEYRGTANVEHSQTVS